jgi:cytochrome c oxidase cbb3-type subunit I/II
MVPALAPMYWVRVVGGLLYISGVLVMVFNLVKTYQTRGDLADTVVEITVPVEGIHGASGKSEGWHRILEGRPLRFTLWTTVAVAAGGLFELIPSMAIKSNVPTIESVRPYSPLELEGRDIYIREGCNNCHSQMVRPLKEETLRYGDFSLAGEYVYDRPFLWGSRRIGPDLQRVGGKYPDLWHYNHMLDPRSTSPGSIMPTYPELYTNELDLSLTAGKVKTFKNAFGAPYSEYEVDNAEVLAQAQAQKIAEGLVAQGVEDVSTKEIVALIAYLQRLGVDLKSATPAERAPHAVETTSNAKE